MRQEIIGQLANLKKDVVKSKKDDAKKKKIESEALNNEKIINEEIKTIKDKMQKLAI